MMMTDTSTIDCKPILRPAAAFTPCLKEDIQYYTTNQLLLEM